MDRLGNMEEKVGCLRIGLGCWVMLWLFIGTISLSLCYFMARSSGFTSPIVPALSASTSKNPEGAIFAELFNIIAILTLVIIVIRYFHVKMINRQVDGGETSHLSQINSLGIVFGLGSAVGVTLVANFRSIEDDNAIQIVHLIGAVIILIGGAAYCWTQTLATYLLTKFGSGVRPVFIARLAITSLLTLNSLLVFTCGGLSYGDAVSHSSLQIVGNISQWIAVWCFGLFALSFFKEFQTLSMNIQCIPKCSGNSSDVLKYSTLPASGNGENATDSD